jgi:hypothetical protein
LWQQPRLVAGISVDLVGFSLVAAVRQQADRTVNSVSRLPTGASVPADPPEWVGDDRLWYRTWPDGSQLVLVDARQRTKTNLLADARIVANLRQLLGAATDSLGGEHADIALAKDGRGLTISIGGKRVRCEVETGSCVAEPPPDRRDGGPRRPPEHLSPDGRRAAFIRDWNLWMRDLAIGAEVQLTRDGTKDNGYATDNAGWIFSDRAILRWSPDSKKIATFQLDQRGVGEMYLVSTRIGHPLLRTWKYAMAGDSIVPMVRRVIIDSEQRRAHALHEYSRAGRPRRLADLLQACGQ